MAESADGASPVMGAPAGLHSNDAARALGQKSEDSVARKRLAECHAAVRAGAMRLKAPLCKVETDDANFFHGCPLHSWDAQTSPPWHTAMPSGGGIHSINQTQILRVIRTRLIGDAEIGTKERGAEFGDQLLDRVGLIPETLPELAIAATRCARPVRQLGKDCRIVGFGRRARRGADESFARRHLNGIRRGAIEGSAAAVADGCAGRGDEGLGPLDRRDDRCGRGLDDGRLIAVDLLGRLKCANSGHVRARLIKRVPGAYSLSAMLARIRSISPCSSAVSGASVSWMASFFRSPVNLNGT